MEIFVAIDESFQFMDIVRYLICPLGAVSFTYLSFSVFPVYALFASFANAITPKFNFPSFSACSLCPCICLFAVCLGPGVYICPPEKELYYWTSTDSVRNVGA